MFRKFTALKRMVFVFGLMLLLVVAGASDAFAQRKGKNDYLLEEDTSKSYVLPYALMGLGIVLGLLLVARPGTRDDKVKIRAVDEDEDLEA